ncbi:MAG: transposase [Treponema sp.]|nr:transposase [Treponema sp.]
MQIKAQLGFIKRNLDNLARFLDSSTVFQMPEKELERLTVIMRVYGQQKEMYDKKVHQCGDRIVSISQPWVRPIKRGKAGADTEFGVKVTFCRVEGNVYVGKMSFDNYNEGDTLIEIIENYYRDFSVYPAEVLADQIYHNKKNRDYCKGDGIKFIGKRLGRKTVNVQKARELQKEVYRAMCDRIEIEGCFGRGKRKFGLNRIKMKLKSTTMTHVALIAMVMNLV